jgi:23S rRNA pseudouridine2457 synthase
LQRTPFNFIYAQNKRYLAFYKPYGVLCQFTSAPESEKQTLSSFGFPKYVYTVGRLDYDSEGLILLTDDANLNALLLDPINRHWRTYLVQVENEPSAKGLDQIRSGLRLGDLKTLPARVELLHEPPTLAERPVPIRFRKSIPTAWLSLSLTEGKNRQVRRMTAQIGCPTLRLVRIALGSLTLANLELEYGTWRAISENEMLQVFREDP